MGQSGVGLAPSHQTTPVPEIATHPPGSHMKSPTTAAILNFLFPGAGYMYTGLGRDAGEMVFGALVFIFFFIGFEMWFALNLLQPPPPASSASVSPYDALILLVFLLPFAFAYDGYRRAKSPER